jgi:hypothetical protein
MGQPNTRPRHGTALHEGVSAEGAAPPSIRLSLADFVLAVTSQAPLHQFFVAEQQLLPA